MSRSRRHLPITGVTIAKSDKPFKVFAARKYRRIEKIAIKQRNYLMPLRFEVANPYDSPKDGKVFWQKEWVDKPWKLWAK